MSSITPALPSVLHSKLLPARHHRTWSVDRRHIQKIPMLHFIGKSPNKAALAKQTNQRPSTDRTLKASEFMYIGSSNVA